MKKLLLSCALLASTFAFNKLNAQCTVTQPAVSNIRKSGCSFTFDLSFNLTGNGGNKVTALYLYSTADYNALPANFYGNDNHVPTSAELNAAKALATIKINKDSALTVYNYQKSGNSFERPASMEGGLTYNIDPSGQITVKDVTVTFTDCASLITLKADVISSQSPDLSSIGCLSKGLAFSPNEPIIRALSKGCGASRLVTTTFITTQARSIGFRLYKDVAPVGVFTADDTLAANAVSPVYYTTTTFNSATNDYRSVGDYAYSVQPGEQFNVWVVANTPGIPNVSTAYATNTCAPLAANFRSISAARIKQNVAVKWETAMEENSRGFYVQRQLGTSEWQNVAFVASQAMNGSSASLLSYAYTDFNPAKGISQYRIQQVSFDGKTSISEIRSVRSEDLAGKVVVYPNPTTNGKVNLAFETANEKDVVVSDMAGRVVKKFSNVRSNNLVIENLNEGFYTIQILDKTNSTSSIEKVVVKQQ
ncbi:T9SS type A sorting domain-containing protein [Flavisolibacter nicotianae]|uniref:T9SS type A sorting domain-containing protein n=1 Tax=Flavisolibacter nicotianae TaxID=2364882 RepID=UPI000EABE75E|nr:T9SS type A sorting domain-containing protein [Flavisolibacter nicotianae]